MSTNQHSVFVLAIDGKPLTPCKPSKARKLLKGGVAKKVWSKFGIFGIQMLVETRRETPNTVLGEDEGTKFEGYAVVCGNENSLNVKWDLPDKKKIVRKAKKRSILRHARRWRKGGRRGNKPRPRKRKGFIAQGQKVVVLSRIKSKKELYRIYPINAVGREDVRFNHRDKRWGANFSTVEIGKAKIRKFHEDQGAKIFEFRGFETKQLREGFGYEKSNDKSKGCFESHCSDALALACQLGPGERVEPGTFIAIDDTYRPVRRRLHDTQPAKGGVREPYSKGTVFGLRKGLLVGTSKGKFGRLCGEYKGSSRYYDSKGKRQTTKQLAWISTQFIRKEEPPPPRAQGHEVPAA